MAVSFSGLGSGIDFSKLVDAAVAQRSQPIAQLQNRSNTLSKRSDALKALNGKLVTLTAAAKALSANDLGTARDVTSSESSVLTASATTSAANGSYKLTVSRLAASLTQSSRVYSSASSAVLAGGATTATFELRKGGAATGASITIDSSSNTLTGLRDAINNAGAGISAAVVDTDGTGTNFKLVLNSNETGAAGRVELIETTTTGTQADLALTSLNVTSGFGDLDAAFTINGLALTRSTSTVSDAIAGVTFNLKSAGSSTISISTGTGDISSKVRNFVSAYNDVQDFILAQYAKDGSGNASGVLVGDATLRSVQQAVREAVGADSNGNGGALKNLTQIGISRDKDGRLTLDDTALAKAITDSQADVKALLAGKTSSDTGLATSIYQSYNRLSDSVTGLVQNAISGYQDSIKRISQSVTEQLARVNQLRDSLSRQYAAADAAINQLNNQGSSLTSILNSLQKKTE
ncbi:MAG: flagellar filament capping protein FliD [Blastocatellia bacterium]